MNLIQLVATIFIMTDLEGVLKRSVRPWNHDDFTSRLLTFEKSVAWFAKPEKISALQCTTMHIVHDMIVW